MTALLRAICALERSAAVRPPWIASSIAWPLVSLVRASDSPSIQAIWRERKTFAICL